MRPHGNYVYSWRLAHGWCWTYSASLYAVVDVSLRFPPCERPYWCGGRMSGLLSQAHHATHNLCNSFWRFCHTGAGIRHSSTDHNSEVMRRGSGSHVRHLLGRFKIPRRSSNHRKGVSSLAALGRGCCAAGVALTAAGLIGWGIQVVMPERSRTWAVLRCANAAATLAALSLDYKLLGERLCP